VTIFCLVISTASAKDIYHNPPAEERAWPFTLSLPSCDDTSVLRKIMHDFESREREYWASSLFINIFEKIKETGVRPYGDSYTPRRYCFSEGLFSDGVKRQVYFSITPDQSVILSGQVIDWCVDGLDRNHADGPHCRRVRNTSDNYNSFQ
jgi:hypothetical protein